MSSSTEKEQYGSDDYEANCAANGTANYVGGFRSRVARSRWAIRSGIANRAKDE